MANSRGRRAVVSLIAFVALIATACDYESTAANVWVIDAQEDGGDEPYLLVISWRSTPGEPGSTQTVFNTNNLTLVGMDIEDDTVVGIPRDRGEWRFDDVQFASTLDQVVGGTSPELLGSVMIAMESDGTPWSVVERMVRSVESALQAELVDEVESMSLLDLTDTGELRVRLYGAAASLSSSVPLAVQWAISSEFAPFMNNDDLIGVGIEFWAAASGPLRPAVDSLLENDLPPNMQGGTVSSGEFRGHQFGENGVLYSVPTSLNAVDDE